MNASHDVHLIYNDRDKPAVERLYQELRKRGLTPWFWIKDAGPNWLDDELTSIEKLTPVSAVFLGAAGWGPSYHRKLAEVAFRLGRPTILVLLPGWHPEDVQSFPQLGKRRWVEFKTLDEGSALTELAQQIVDGAYEPRAEPAAELQARQQPAGRGRRLMVYVPARSQSLIPGTRCEIASHASRTCRDACGTGIPTSQECGRPSPWKTWPWSWCRPSRPRATKQITRIPRTPFSTSR